MIKKLIKDYLMCTIEYRKAVARRMTLSAQKSSKKTIDLATNREKELSKTLVTYRNRIKTENNYIPALKKTSSEELWCMIKSIDETLTNKQIKKVLNNLIKMGK